MNKQKEDLRPMEMLVGLIVYAAVVILCGVALLFLAFGSPQVRAATPAEVTVIGIPSSWRVECSYRRNFAVSVIEAREAGATLNQVHLNVVTQIVEAGQPIAKACPILKNVTAVWQIQGNAAGIGNAVYEACMKERA